MTLSRRGERGHDQSSMLSFGSLSIETGREESETGQVFG